MEGDQSMYEKLRKIEMKKCYSHETGQVQKWMTMEVMKKKDM